jgi:hypothetical protein
VLDDHARRQRELAQQEPRGREIVQVVERQRPAGTLLDTREQVDSGARLRVVRRALVRVLAVRELVHLRKRGDEHVRERIDLGEPARDRHLVRSRRRERVGGERPAHLERDRAALANLREHRVVLRGSRDGRDVREVLRRRTQHRRAAHVDHLDRFLLAHAVARDDLRERVEVDAHEVERPDVVLVERRNVVLAVASREDPRVDARVQRLHAAAEHLRRLGHRLDLVHGEAELLQMRCGAAARYEIPAEVREPSRERVEAGLVEDGDQRAQSSRTTFGSSLCSTAWTRAFNVSTVSPSWTGTGSAVITGPVSIPSSTKCTVAAVSGTPAARTSSMGCAPGNSGSGAECVFTIRPP